MFNSQIKAWVNERSRLLISDDFETHKSLNVLNFCYENNIILCRLFSHTSHKLQLCDVEIFESLKSAYREQVERLYRDDAETVDKRHFTYLYDQARQQAMVKRNISSDWSKCDLFQFNLVRVVWEANLSQLEIEQSRSTYVIDLSHCDKLIKTFVMLESLTYLRKKIEQNIETLNWSDKHHIQKLYSVTERVFAERSLLLDENKLLFKQNNEKIYRQSTSSWVSDTVKVMSYENIVKAEKRRDAKTKASRSLESQRRVQERKSDHDINQEKKVTEIEIRKLELIVTVLYCNSDWALESFFLWSHDWILMSSFCDRKHVLDLYKHDHETFLPLSLLVSKVSSDCFKMSRGERLWVVSEQCLISVWVEMNSRETVQRRSTLKSEIVWARLQLPSTTCCCLNAVFRVMTSFALHKISSSSIFSSSHLIFSFFSFFSLSHSLCRWLLLFVSWFVVSKSKIRCASKCDEMRFDSRLSSLDLFSISDVMKWDEAESWSEIWWESLMTNLFMIVLLIDHLAWSISKSKAMWIW